MSPLASPFIRSILWLLLILAVPLGVPCGSPESPAPAAPTSISGAWGGGPPSLGDAVTFTAKVPIPEAEYFLTGPFSAGTEWGEGRIRQVRQNPPEKYPGHLTLSITLQVFQTGQAEFPPLPFSVNTAHGNTAYSLAPPPLAVRPLLPEDAASPPPPAAPMPYPRPVPWGLLTLLGLGLILAAALVRRLWKKARGAEADPLPPKPQEVDPDAWIRDEVDRIFRGDLEPRLLYGLLSQRLREYLQIRTARPYPDWTTEEILRYAPAEPLLGTREREHLSGNLQLCDRAKFAKYVPPPTERDKVKATTLEVLDGVLRKVEEARRP